MKLARYRPGLVQVAELRPTVKRTVALITLLLILFTLTLSSASGQQGPPSSLDRERSRAMLGAIKDDLKSGYYDPNYHGMDLETRFRAADEKIKQAASLGQIFGIIGQVLSELDDSHTFFAPPSRSTRTDYGWAMQLIGTKCYVVKVKPKSDAEAKGLKEGDEISSIDGRVPVRENIWKLNYLYHALRPQPGMRLVVIKPDGTQKQIDIVAKVEQGRRMKDLTDGFDLYDLIRGDEKQEILGRSRYIEAGDDVFIWKMPEFNLTKEGVDELVDKFRKRKALILDLRGNGGGYEETLLRLLGNMFDHEVRMGTLKRRKEEKPMIVKARGNAFAGKVMVLIDSESGSAAELFARVMQLEKRGIVIGDVSAGAVMRAKSYSRQLGLDIVVFYGVSITDADIIMTDGKSLEHVGVIPDELKLPTPADLAAKRDPVLAYAASLAGLKLDPARAGRMFPTPIE